MGHLLSAGSEGAWGVCGSDAADTGDDVCRVQDRVVAKTIPARRETEGESLRSTSQACIRTSAKSSTVKVSILNFPP